MNIILSNASKDPFYIQIYEQIKKQVLNKSLKEGEHLPSMRNLAKDLGVSVITAKRAYEELEKENYIYSIVGKGSFIAEQNLELIKQKKQKVIEEQLSHVIVNSREIDLSLKDLHELLDILYEE